MVKLKLAARWFSSSRGVDKHIANYPKGWLTPGSYRFSVCSGSSFTTDGDCRLRLDIAGFDDPGSPNERISVRLSSAPGRHASPPPGCSRSDVKPVFRSGPWRPFCSPSNGGCSGGIGGYVDPRNCKAEVFQLGVLAAAKAACFTEPARAPTYGAVGRNP